MQIRGHHPVRLRLPPLRRRGISLVQTRCHHPIKRSCRVQKQCDCSSVSVLDISPPEEGNCFVQIRGHHPVRLRLPPLHRRGITASAGGELALQRRGIALCRYEDTTPSGFARHPSRGGELALQRRGIALCRYEDTTPSSGAAGCRSNAIAVVYLC